MHFWEGAVGLGHATSSCLHSGFDQDLLDLDCCFKNPEMLISEECRNHMLPSNLLPFPWFLGGASNVSPWGKVTNYRSTDFHGMFWGSKDRPIQ